MGGFSAAGGERGLGNDHGLAKVECGAIAGQFPAGAVLFDTTQPGGRVRSYHAMVIRPGAARTTAAGGVEIPIADMTGASIRWPQDEQWYEVQAECFIGWFPELPPERTREALEELEELEELVRLYTDPGRLEKETYTLALHGIWREDPNAPGDFLPGIACSCASLVEHCYESISSRIDLVRQERVPALSAAELWALVGTAPWTSSIPRVLAAMGLKAPPGGSGLPRWPVLLPAYQMRAFARGLALLPGYHPQPNDHPYT